ncbi:hypothetical protein EI74_0770 [Mycoplasma testudineum]|uniref:Uncharacterized protein n=1 Tax=Mycoplasma testudineum TaxID=244584 RepID=A0A4R6IC05_9MOLU|nr:hypothetical protein [Mycoplasma testudineum]OYD26541.1 hypothetical protein CG473_03440 [Mycoplasma testudineum]TDO19121.1 hypothetical protein EI74_0770 [Mycoplasma testudineum]
MFNVKKFKKRARGNLIAIIFATIFLIFSIVLLSQEENVRNWILSWNIPSTIPEELRIFIVDNLFLVFKLVADSGAWLTILIIGIRTLFMLFSFKNLFLLLRFLLFFQLISILSYFLLSGLSYIHSIEFLGYSLPIIIFILLITTSFIHIMARKIS